MNKTLEEMNIVDLDSYYIMMCFCGTIVNLGLAPLGYSSLPFRDANPSTHFAGACFKFYKIEDTAFFGEPYITVKR